MVAQIGGTTLAERARRISGLGRVPERMARVGGVAQARPSLPTTMQAQFVARDLTLRVPQNFAAIPEDKISVVILVRS